MHSVSSTIVLTVYGSGNDPRHISNIANYVGWRRDRQLGHEG